MESSRLDWFQPWSENPPRQVKQIFDLTSNSVVHPCWLVTFRSFQLVCISNRRRRQYSDKSTSPEWRGRKLRLRLILRISSLSKSGEVVPLFISSSTSMYFWGHVHDAWSETFAASLEIFGGGGGQKGMCVVVGFCGIFTRDINWPPKTVVGKVIDPWQSHSGWLHRIWKTVEEGTKSIGGHGAATWTWNISLSTNTFTEKPYTCESFSKVLRRRNTYTQNVAYRHKPPCLEGSTINFGFNSSLESQTCILSLKILISIKFLEWLINTVRSWKFCWFSYQWTCSKIGELHQQAPCYVYVLCLRSTLLKLGCFSNRLRSCKTYT